NTKHTVFQPKAYVLVYLISFEKVETDICPREGLILLSRRAEHLEEPCRAVVHKQVNTILDNVPRLKVEVVVLLNCLGAEAVNVECRAPRVPNRSIHPPIHQHPIDI